MGKSASCITVSLTKWPPWWKSASCITVSLAKWPPWGKSASCIIVSVHNPHLLSASMLKSEIIFYYLKLTPLLTLTGLEGHICPSLVKGRTYMSLCCNIMVVSLWCHLQHHELGGAKIILYCGQRDMCSWSMVNNEENWLPWQIKDCFFYFIF